MSPSQSLAEQERICRELESTSGSFQRLRLVMDTWCSLWFWPLDRVSDLPTRDAFLASARLLLSGDPPDAAWTGILSVKLGFEITGTVIVKLSANPKFNDKSFVPSSHYSELELYRAVTTLFDTSENE